MRLIDADALKLEMNKLYEHHLLMGNFTADGATSDCIDMVDAAPTIDPTACINPKPLVVHGKWVRVKNEQGYTTHANCSNCGYVIISSVCETSICPSCNAHMYKEDKP